MKLGTLHVHNFRGIKDLRLDLRQKSFVIAGPNGSGKSGLVDAIEFVFTGRISRLEGAGTGGLSVKEHGPHVDDRGKPKDSWVEITVMLDDGQEATITRRVDQPNKARVVPPEAGEAIRWVEDHPEIALSRREIIKYVLAEPGQRSKELQAVLKLDRLETARKVLGRAVSKLDDERERCTTGLASAKENLRTGLGTEDVGPEAILLHVNQRRRVLGLLELTEFTESSELGSGLVQSTPGGAAGVVVDKELATRDLDALVALVGAHEVPDARAREVLSRIAELDARPGLLELVNRHGLIEQGLALAASDECPLCDHMWEPGALIGHLRDKLEQASQAGELVARMRADAAAVRHDVQCLVDRLETVACTASGIGGAMVSEPLRAWRDDLVVFRDALTTPAGILAARARMNGGWARPSDGAAGAVREVRVIIDGLAPPSQAEEARKYLLVGDERLAVVRTREGELRKLEARYTMAARVKLLFDQTIEEKLVGLYAAIETDLVRFYRFLNDGDEDDFAARLSHEPGKISLEVEFFGRGLFPPGAYHSEGHQDGMGLCLYLALMRQLFGERFTFGVLDDVVMSVDKGHRKRVCELLKTEFAGTQFIVTTHDDVWLHQMVNCGFVSKRGVRRFRGWSVERGPLVDDYRDSWEAVAEHLSKDDCSSAAALLRRHLEEVAGDLCERLAAAVLYRRDGDHSLGDLLPAAIGRWTTLLARAKGAASSWNQRELVEAIAERERTFKERLAATEKEKWAINKSVHHNEWATLTAKELGCVVAAYRDLLATFRCVSCDGWIDLLSVAGTSEALVCDCKKVCLNLQRKTAN